MNCREFREHWTEWHEGDPQGQVRDLGLDMERHRRECAACARHDGQMRRMIDALGTLPLPGEASATHRPNARPRWAALAATLALGVALGVLLTTRLGGGPEMQAQPVVLDGAGVHRVAIAFESPKRLESVEFVVELPRGVELVGFPGQRSVRWPGRLAAGRSQLQLPLRVADDVELGTLVTRVVHESGERRLTIPLRLANGETHDDAA